MEKVLRSSESWVALVVLVGHVGASAGWWVAQDFDQFIAPALVYVAARIASKFVKNIQFGSPPRGGNQA